MREAIVFNPSPYSPYRGINVSLLSPLQEATLSNPFGVFELKAIQFKGGWVMIQGPNRRAFFKATLEEVLKVNSKVGFQKKMVIHRDPIHGQVVGHTMKEDKDGARKKGLDTDSSWRQEYDLSKRQFSRGTHVSTETWILNYLREEYARLYSKSYAFWEKVNEEAESKGILHDYVGDSLSSY